jgi:hypothetical protein
MTWSTAFCTAGPDGDHVDARRRGDGIDRVDRGHRLDHRQEDDLSISGLDISGHRHLQAVARGADDRRQAALTDRRIAHRGRGGLDIGDRVEMRHLDADGADVEIAQDLVRDIARHAHDR